MTERRRGLGRGLGALIPSGSTGTAAPVDVFFAQRPVTPVPHGGPDERPGEGVEGGPGSAAPVLPEPREESAAAYFSDVPVDAITANPRQPRQVFDPDDLAELVHSLREVGMLQPLVVRPVGEGRFELVMGERRLRAAREAGWASVPAIVRRTADADLLRDALLENLHRSQLNPLEEAAAYGQLLDDFGCTHDELAARIGRSRPQISNTLRLLRLPVAVQKRVAAGVLSAGHARALAGIEDPAVQERLAGRVVAEGLSVRAVEEIVAVGEDGTAAPRARRARQPTPVAPRLAEVAERLSDRYDTRVKVDLGVRRGRIVVEFASVADLERIVEVMLTGD